jgi:hypothetical protein
MLEARDCPSIFVDAPNTGIAPNNINVNNSVSWVDFNGNGRPDLWIGGEIMAPGGAQQPPNLYVNEGNGTFVDAFSSVFPPNNPLEQLNDAHGSAWGDIFNTGSPDFLQISGALGGRTISGSFFFANRNGQMTEEASADGLTGGLGGGRSPLLLDWNHDGLLDTLYLNHSRPGSVGSSALYQQTPTGFVDVTAQSGLSTHIKDGAWAQSVDLTGDGVPDLVVGQSVESGKPPLLFKSTPHGYELQQSAFPNDPYITDMAVGDFFNTGYNDVFFTRRNANMSDVTQSGPNLIAGFLTKGNQTGFTFQSTGSITFDFNEPSYNDNQAQTSQIFIGSKGYNPTTLPFTLDPNNPNNQGIVSHNPSSGNGMYIGYDPAHQLWQVYYAKQGTSMNPFVINVSSPATNLTPIGFNPSAEALQPYFLVYNPQTKSFVDETAQAGLATPLSAVNVVAGDFTNSGYLDLYVSCEHQVSDLGGVLYLNNGNGTFTAVPGVPAYSGIFYANPEDHAGRTVSVADFNGDGTLDLFLPHTMFQTPNVIYNDAPNELLYNTSTGNNWIELNLHGVVSNRDALGAIVRLTAGGVTQRRDVTGGKHVGAQNSNVVHFGLGHNTTIDRIEIDWPSGILQVLTNVTVDQIMNVVEPGGHTISAARPITVFSPNQTYSGSLDNVNTQDFYQYTTVTPSIVNLSASGQVIIQLLDQSGNLIAQSQSQNGLQVLTANAAAGSYFVRIFLNSQSQSSSYALTFDVIAAVPVISNLAINPPAFAAPPATITATASTVNTGNAIVGGAEFFIDNTGANGTGYAMSAADGSFDQSTEGIMGTIDAQIFATLTVGNHQLFVHARDTQGNWGAFNIVIFKMDNQGPITDQLTVTPKKTSTPPSISCRISDKTSGLSKVVAAEYFIDATGANGTGFAMTPGQEFEGGVIKLFSAAMSSGVFSGLAAGKHTIYVHGQDELGNWGPFVSVAFTKVGTAVLVQLASPLAGSFRSSLWNPEPVKVRNAFSAVANALLEAISRKPEIPEGSNDDQARAPSSFNDAHHVYSDAFDAALTGPLDESSNGFEI